MKFDYPVIAVGNLSVGGTGKTPHIEYLIKMLSPHVKIGVLSRGYKRKSGGYRDVRIRNNVGDVGDEPLQIKRKFRHVAVSVSENRSLGIPQLLQQNPEVKVVLLDDAFQHRGVEPSMNILLTTCMEPFWKDLLLPAGKLREWRNGAQRADAIIVTKCPEEMEKVEADHYIRKLARYTSNIYFSRLKYGHPYFLFDSSIRAALGENIDVILMTGIADSGPLKEYIRSRVNSLFSLDFGDHHNFSNYDIAQLKKVFANLESEHKIVIITEKDAVRLDAHLKYINDQRIPIFVLPVEVDFLFDHAEKFDAYVKNFLLEFKA